MTNFKELKTRPPGEKLRSLVADYRPGQKKNSKIHEIELTHNEKEVLIDQLNTTEHIVKHIRKDSLNTTEHIDGSIIKNHDFTQLNTEQVEVTKHSNLTINIEQKKNLIDQLNTTEHIVKHIRKDSLNTTEHIDGSIIKNHDFTQLNTEQVEVTKHSNKSTDSKSKKTTTPHSNFTQLNTQINTTTHSNFTQLNTDANALFINFMKQGGLRAKVLNFLYEEGLRQNSKVINISYLMLARLSGINEKSIKTTTKRLKDSKYIEIYGPNGGKSPTKSFVLNESLITSYILLKSQQLHTTPHSNFTQLNTQINTEPSRQTDRGLVLQFEKEENSFPKKENKEKLSTLSNSAKRQTTWNFANLDFSAVHPISLTIVNVAIQRDAEMTLTQEVVQDFINRFATYLSFQNAKKIQNSCGLFCSELKKLINPSQNGRTQVLDFETEAERKINAEIAQKIIKIQMENELVEKARELSSDKEKFESEKEVWMQKVRSSSQGINLSEEIIYITAFGNWKEAQQK